MSVRPNSIALYCTSGQRNKVQADLTTALQSLIPIELTVHLSTNGNTVTHYGAHMWLRDDELKAVLDIPGLTVQGAVLDKHPRDNWLSHLKGGNMQVMLVDVKDGGKLVAMPKEDPKNNARIEAAKVVFNQKPKDRKDARDSNSLLQGRG